MRLLSKCRLRVSILAHNVQIISDQLKQLRGLLMGTL